MSELITEKELCEWLDIVPKTAWSWRKKGMPYLGTKKSIKYNKEKVTEWLEKQNESNGK